MCLGQGEMVDLRAAVRADPSGGLIDAALDEAMRIKPKGHDFSIEAGERNISTTRHMSVTGG